MNIKVIVIIVYTGEIDNLCCGGVWLYSNNNGNNPTNTGQTTVYIATISNVVSLARLGIFSVSGEWRKIIFLPYIIVMMD